MPRRPPPLGHPPRDPALSAPPDSRPFAPAPAPPDALQVLVDARRPLPPACPHCGCGRLVRWGTFSGRQRWRCKACRRTSSDLTGTALAYTKRLALWGDFAGCMLSSRSCRDTARRLGIHKDTAWRWRHRLLERLLTAPEPSLRGSVELLEVRVLVCRKGERRLGRPPLRRGSPFPILPGLGSGHPAPAPQHAGEDEASPGRLSERARAAARERAMLLVACDREEHSRALLVWHAGPRRTDELATLLGLATSRAEPASPEPDGPAPGSPEPGSPAPGSPAPGSPKAGGPAPGSREPGCGEPGGPALRLLSRGRTLSAYGELARRHGLSHRCVAVTAPGPGVRTAGGAGRPRNSAHLGTVSGAVRRLRGWLRRFNGVATKYLLRYWAWHRFLDAIAWSEAVRRLLASAGGRGA